jgi:hypothetical protein
MLHNKSSLRFTSWLAILAMALNALWPLLANAKPAGFSPLTEICTAQGVKSIAGEAGSTSDDSGTKHLQPHCPLCSFGTDKVSAPPSAPLRIDSASASGAVSFVAFQSAEPRSDIRTPAHPRAPPARS